MKIKWGWVLGATVAVTLIGATSAVAHPTGHESRNKSQCAVLPGSDPPAAPGFDKSPANMRYNCDLCVAQGNHHYHPDCPAGQRCNKDDGKPICNNE